jgi:hypothetical protein
LTAIDFDDELVLKTNKIQDVGFEGYLLAKFKSREASVSKQPPHGSFSVGLRMAHRPRVSPIISHCRMMMRADRHDPSPGSGLWPSPPSPTGGEGKKAYTRIGIST